jgi:cytochrome c-type biogenesis protein
MRVSDRKLLIAQYGRKVELNFHRDVTTRGLRGKRRPASESHMDLNVTLGAAVLAGIFSFLSPCVLPLVPPYLVYISGVSLEDLATQTKPEIGSNRARVMVSALLFVLGFSTVFVLLGATAFALGNVLRQNLPLLSQIAGVAIIIMGLHFLGVFRFGFLAREARFQPTQEAASYAGAYVVGLAFAFGWTPCIGPVLAAILSVAGSEESVWRGMGLLAFYSLGLGIPFLIAAFSVNAFLGFSRRFRQHIQTVEKVMGGLLVLTGVMFLTGWMQNISYWLLEQFPALSTIG